MSFRSRTFFIAALVLVVGIGFLAPGEARAWCIFRPVGCAADAFSEAIFGLIYAIGYLFGYLIAFFGSILEYVIRAGNIGQAEAIKAAWVAVRDLANLFFGLGMVVIALATIFRLEGYGWKRALPRLIVAALLINFSFVIAGTIIDVGNIFSFFFLNQFTGATLGPAIASALGVENLVDLKQSTEGSNAATSAIGQTLGTLASFLLTIVLLAVTAVTFGVGIVFLFVRIFMLWLLIVLSPVIWIAWVFPGTESYWKKWWETFLKWVFFGPIYIFMIWLALYIVTSKATITNLITSTNLANQQIQHLGKSQLINKAGTPEMLMQFGFMTMMMFGALYVGQMGGMYGAQAGMKIAQGVPKFGLRMADRWAARGANMPRILPLVSKASSWAAKKTGIKGLEKIARVTEKTIGERMASGMGKKWAGWRGEESAEKWAGRLRWLRRTAPALASPAAMKRAYAAISARTDEVSYAGAGGRLQDAWYSTVPWEWRETGYEEREIEGLEHAMSKEIETSTTEEQLSGDINELLPKALAGDKQAQATLIAALDKDVPLNGLNTMIASLPEDMKKAMKEASIEIAEKHKVDTAAKVAGVRTRAGAATAEAVSERSAAAAVAVTDPIAAAEHIAKAEDLERRALAFKNQADEMKAISDDGGEIDKQISAIKRGNVHQGFFLRAFLERTLGDTHRAARVANDIAVNARQAGNHSFSGVSKFNTGTGEFEWNDYYGMKSETAGQFRKGQPQLTMRMFHPDIFMRDESGRLTPTLSTHGLSVTTDGMTFNHIREIHQTRPETSENFMDNFEAIQRQFTSTEDKEKIRQIVGKLLRYKEEHGGTRGKYWIADLAGQDWIVTEDPPGTIKFIVEAPNV